MSSLRALADRLQRLRAEFAALQTPPSVPTAFDLSALTTQLNALRSDLVLFQRARSSAEYDLRAFDALRADAASLARQLADCARAERGADDEDLLRTNAHRQSLIITLNTADEALSKAQFTVGSLQRQNALLNKSRFVAGKVSNLLFENNRLFAKIDKLQFGQSAVLALVVLVCFWFCVRGLLG